MKGAYLHKPRKEEKKITPIVHHCESCQHFVWGLRTAFYDTDGSCSLTKYAKSHSRDGCQYWEAK